MQVEDRKRKRIAALVTVVFHIIIALLFLFFGLKQPNPLPEPQGASVEFGWDETGSMADLQSPATPVEPTPTPVSEPAPTEDIQEEVLTEEDSEVSIPSAEAPKPKPKPETKPKPEPKPETKPTPNPEPKPEPVEAKPQVSDALRRAMESMGKPGEGAKGDTGGQGSQGSQEGTTGQGSLGGGTGSWQLDGRSMTTGHGSKIKDTKEEGIVVLNITVDRNGKVTSATPNLRESTTTSQYLINLATTDAVNNFRFNADQAAAFEQRGKVRYVFKLQ